MSKLGSLLLVVACLFVASPAFATVEVYFNGVRVTGLKNQLFEGCKVRFDAKGNVHVTAKGYTVKTAEKASGDTSKGTPKATLSNHYFLVSAGKAPKSAQYDVDVFVNGKWVRKIRSSEDQVVFEITSHLKKGKNVINFSATKNFGGKPRVGTTADVYLRVLVGLGNQGGGTVNITKTLVDFRAPASRVDNFGTTGTILAK